MCKLRKVSIQEGKYAGEQCLFHCWAGLSEHPKAVVEMDGGKIAVLYAEDIAFDDEPTPIKELDTEE